MRISILASIVLFGLANSFSASAQAIETAARTPSTGRTLPTPIVPLSTSLGHWDNHWSFWLPNHPRFEMVEVASNDPENGKDRSIWVWFTERAGSKEQHHYRSRDLPLFQNGRHTEFNYETTGNLGEPRGLTVSFRDSAGELVEIGARMAPDTKLSREGAGLTGQMGHSIARIFLIFYKTQRVIPVDAHVRVSGTNYAMTASEDLGRSPFRWIYSNDVHTNVILYGTFPIAPGTNGYEAIAGEANRFKRLSPDGGWETISTDAEGRLLSYRHEAGDSRLLHFQFDPGLPNCTETGKALESRFGIYLKNVGEVMNGLIETSCRPEGPEYKWRLVTPRQVWGRGISTMITRAPDGSATLTIRPVE